jgi:hypothetical protein
MNAVELPFETWRAVIDALRAKGLPYMLEHADHLERLLDQHPGVPSGPCNGAAEPE